MPDFNHYLTLKQYTQAVPSQRLHNSYSAASDDGMSYTSGMVLSNSKSVTTPMTPVEGETSTTPRTDTSSNISQSFVSPTTQSTTPFGHLQATPTQPTFMPDFGLSALSSLTQIAKLQSNTPKDYPSTILHPNAFSQTTSLGPTPDTLPQSRVYAVFSVKVKLKGKNFSQFFILELHIYTKWNIS